MENFTDGIWLLVGILNLTMLAVVVAAITRRWQKRRRDAQAAQLECHEPLPPIEQLPTDDPNSLSKLAEHCKRNRKRNEETLEMLLTSMGRTNVPVR